MGSPIDGAIARRMREAFDLYDSGLALMRQNLRRRFPADDETAIERRLLDWRLHRRDAPNGDADGVVVAFPRSRR